jgi:hypothetical protein
MRIFVSREFDGMYRGVFLCSGSSAAVACSLPMLQQPLPWQHGLFGLSRHAALDISIEDV